MPPNKKKREPVRTITIRPKNGDHDRIAAEAQEIARAGGFPVSLSAYALHATLAYPRLRKIESLLLLESTQKGGDVDSAEFALDLLARIQ